MNIRKFILAMKFRVSIAGDSFAGAWLAIERFPGTDSGSDNPEAS